MLASHAVADIVKLLDEGTYVAHSYNDFNPPTRDRPKEKRYAALELSSLANLSDDTKMQIVGSNGYA